MPLEAITTIFPDQLARSKTFFNFSHSISLYPPFHVPVRNALACCYSRKTAERKVEKVIFQRLYFWHRSNFSDTHSGGFSISMRTITISSTSEAVEVRWSEARQERQAKRVCLFCCDEICNSAFPHFTKLTLIMNKGLPCAFNFPPILRAKHPQ